LKERFLIPASSKESLGNEALASYITGAAKETVKALGFSPPPLWKRGVGEVKKRILSQSLKPHFLPRSASKCITY